MSGPSRFPAAATADRWFAAILLLVCWVLDLPATDPDDLFFLDAPVTLATTGDMRAPTLTGLLLPFGSDHYYLQTPHVPAFLAQWFTMVGVSHFAVKAIHYAAYGACAWLLGGLLLKLGIPLAFRLVLQWLNLNYLLGWHLRPEVMAMVPLLGAVALVVGRPRPPYVPALAAWLSGLAAVMAPNFIPAALLVLFCAVRRFLTAASVGKEWLGRAGFLAAGVGGSHALLFHWLINGEWGAFLRQFTAHATARNQAFDFKILAEKLTFGWNDRLVLPWVVVAVIILVLSSVSKVGTVERRIAWFALCALGLQIAFRARLASQFTFLALLGVVLVLAAWAGKRGRVAGWVAALGAAGAILMVYYATPLSLLQDRTPPAPGAVALLRELTSRNPARELVIDAVAARFVFDWKVPLQARHYQYRHPLPRFEPLPGDVPGTGLWLVSAPLLHKFTPAVASGDYERLRVGPVHFRTMAGRPYEILVAGESSLPSSFRP